MAYDETLTDRIREILAHLPEVEEKKMFMGVCFMVNGKMCIGVAHHELMCRVGPGSLPTALEHGARQMVMKDRPMKDYVLVQPQDFRTRPQLHFWIGLALRFNPEAKASRKTGKKG